MAKKYPCQSLFDFGAALWARKTLEASEDVIVEIIRKTVFDYSNSYIVDRLEVDWHEARRGILKLYSALPEEIRLTWLLHYEWYTKNFNPDGSRQSRLFGGTWFNFERELSPDRVKHSLGRAIGHKYKFLIGEAPHPSQADIVRLRETGLF